MIRLVATALVATTIAATPAAADFYIRKADGNYLVISDLLVLLAAVLLLAGIYALYESLTNSDDGDDDDIHPEISTPEPAEYYDDQASRARALKRKLDAETDLAESFINAKRTRAELYEIEEILGNDRAKRRR